MTTSEVYINRVLDALPPAPRAGRRLPWSCAGISPSGLPRDSR